jgi:hypothetical protein
MKSIYFMGIFISTLFHCSKGTSGNPNALLLILAQNPSNSQYTTILEMERRDISSFKGKCLDSFLGMTANSYFDLHYPEPIRDLPDSKVRLSTKPCNLLGFSGGVSNRITNIDFSFRSAICEPATSLCTNASVRESGF